MTTLTQVSALTGARHNTVADLEGLAGSPGRRVRWVLVADVIGALAAVTAVVALDVLPAELAAPAGVVWILLLTVLTAGAGARVDLHLRGVATAGLVLATICWLSPLVAQPAATQGQIAAAAAVVVGTALVARLVGVAAIARTHVQRLVLVGSALDVAATLDEIRRTRSPRWLVVGACVGDVAADLDLPSDAVRDLDRVAESSLLLGADAVLALPSEHLPPTELRRLAWQLEGTATDLYVGTGIVDVAPARTSLSYIGGVGLLQVRPAPRKGVRRIVKDVTERLACALLVLLLLPLLTAISVAIRLDSRGPAIFRQQRVGRNGRTFVMYKFRTMTVDADATKEDLAADNECDGVLFKIRADPRVTRLGRVLRRYSLDELPQLFNVIRGHMSLVGPRPALPDEVSLYTIDPRRRLVVKPGLTGLWQVSGRSDLSWEESVRLDLRYVDNWSLALDLAIVARTLRAVLGHRGAY